MQQEHVAQVSQPTASLSSCFLLTRCYEIIHRSSHAGQAVVSPPDGAREMWTFLLWTVAADSAPMPWPHSHVRRQDKTDKTWGFSNLLWLGKGWDIPFLDSRYLLSI